ncbi:MAG: response regulator transcription factor [Coriobacteriia bacterium]|nr:response regulator transcription factor [Coriobacteriia bacterium]
MRVLIVDDDPIVRSSLATILQAQGSITVCGEGADGLEAVRRFEEMLPDILLMDIQMPLCTGLEAAELILSSHPEARIVFLTTFSDDEYIIRALRCGARGYLIKQEVAQITPALHAVIAGQMVLGGEVLAKVDALISPAHAPARAPGLSSLAGPLTTRESEIVELIAQGLDNKEIAARIYISEGTVRNHVSVILQKLQLKNRTQLAVYYYQNL